MVPLALLMLLAGSIDPGHNCYSFAMLGPLARHVGRRQRNPGARLLRRPFTAQDLLNGVLEDAPGAQVAYRRDAPGAQVVYRRHQKWNLRAEKTHVCGYIRPDGRDFHFVRKETGQDTWQHVWGTGGQVRSVQDPVSADMRGYRLEFCVRLPT